MVGQSTWKFGSFEADPVQRQVRRDGQALPVGSRALDLLLVLIEQRHRVVTKTELLDRVWAGLVVEEANIHVQVSLLRRELGSGAIVTVPGRGYRFAAALDGDVRVLPAAAAASNRPVELEPLLGRDAELAQLLAAMAQHRIVVISGPGGIGKTRVAQALAWRIDPLPPQGLWWVDLAPATAPDQAVVAIANAAHLQLGGSGGVDALLHALHGHDALLVLDNVERLAADLAPLLQQMQLCAPGLRVLATSQEALRVAGAFEYRLGPLTLPEAGTPLAQARLTEALRLLECRARAIDHRFELRDDNLAAAVDLVRRLDGNALAIEMAAARVPMLGVAGLVQRLDERFELLRAPQRSAAPRQQTLQAMLDWSLSLLADDERALLRQLSVCAGSFRVETVQAMAEAAGLDPWAALDRLEALVAKSLVQLDALDPPRCRLLDTVRLFAWRELQQHGVLDATLLHHGQALARLADAVDTRFWELGDAEWLAQHAPDYDDLQVAFERAVARGDADCAARVGTALMRLDHLRGLNAPRTVRARALHALRDRASQRAQGMIWTALASHGLIAVDQVSRLEAARRAVETWRALGEPGRLHFALGFLAAEEARRGALDEADRLLAECRALEAPDWPARRRAWAASAEAGAAIYSGDAVRYREASRRELACAEQAGADRTAAWARLKLADAALMAGDLAEARSLGQAAVHSLRLLDQPANLGLALSNLCAAHLLAGDAPAARAAAVEAVPLMWRNGWGHLLADALAVLAVDAASEGPAQTAARLLGWADAWYAAHEDRRQPNEARLAAEAEHRLQAILARQALDQARAEGRSLADAEAEALARQLVSTA